MGEGDRAETASWASWREGSLKDRTHKSKGKKRCLTNKDVVLEQTWEKNVVATIGLAWFEAKFKEAPGGGEEEIFA